MNLCIQKPSEIEVEKKKSENEVGDEELEEVWKQMLDSFKEQAIKVQGMSQEAYEAYSKKSLVILKEASKRLKIQAVKARRDLSKLANEISVKGKEYLSTVAEKSPEEVKDIVETFSKPPNDFKQLSKVQDFYLGIPYGALLSLGGFLSFMLTGSVSAIRFGVILGGTLLALSISSLRLWKIRESSALALKGQAVHVRHPVIFKLLPKQAAMHMNHATKFSSPNAKSPKGFSGLPFPGYDSYPENSNSIKMLEAALQFLTNLCSVLNDMEPICVLNHVFVLREYMKECIHGNFRRRLLTVLKTDNDLQRPYAGY